VRQQVTIREHFRRRNARIGSIDAREQVTAFERPTYFAYRLSDFTFAIKMVRCRSRSSRSVDRRRA
jgi:hypothetical protein